MKGKKLRLGLVFLSLALLLCSLPGCGRNNSSVLQLPDGTAAAASNAKETPGPLKPLGSRTCKVGQETIPESTLFSFVLTEANFDPLQGLSLKIQSTNKSPARDFVVSLPYLAVNGYMQDVEYEAPVAANQTVAGEILIPAASLRSAGVSTVDELILYPLIYDETMPMGQGDVVDGAFSFYPTGQGAGNVVYPVRQKTSSEQTFFDNGYASVITLDALEEGDDLNVHYYLENKTDQFLSFAWSDVTMNGAAVNYSGDAIVAPGMRRYETASLPAADVSNANEIAFKVSVTPLSSDGNPTSPLVEQRGTYSFDGASAGGTSTDPDGDGTTGIDPDDISAEATATASPMPGPTIYTSPTAAQKKNAKNGYVNKDQVNMRTGPGTKYKTIGKKVDQNSTAILYELQDGWWFLKCNNKYGYIKADYVSLGKPKATPKPDEDSKTFDGVVTAQSKAALRKNADPDSKCLKELSHGTKVTVHYKTKGKDGNTWYCVSYGKTKGYIRSDLVKVTGKVPSR
jgi:hypothetical protein